MGCNISNIDGSEKIFDKKLTLPIKFSLTPIMPPIIDQGESSQCVAASLVACLNYVKNIQENDNNEQFIINELYRMRKNSKQDNMDIKDGLSILLHKGVFTPNTRNPIMIKSYEKINSDIDLKTALMLNGPCPVTLPVRSYDSKFWKGKDILGYHCVVITGFDENGFEIRNSWGDKWAKNGYTHISYEDFNDNVIEMWTMIK